MLDDAEGGGHQVSELHAGEMLAKMKAERPLTFTFGRTLAADGSDPHEPKIEARNTAVVGASTQRKDDDAAAARDSAMRSAALSAVGTSLAHQATELAAALATSAGGDGQVSVEEKLAQKRISQLAGAITSAVNQPAVGCRH